ncbi:small terminase protein [uncultured Caudovirales phage]|uniref:Small terminase protein n=1 Tax=uncultured Caudovirales phage TaxID=2100421 RepID=A0A6J5L9Y0_9CAUD|nr:small terminase protein [uncultured Caudovirales phage]
MNANNDPLGTALNLTPLATDNAVKSIVAKAHSDTAKNDFEMARANIHEVIQNGTYAIEKLSQIADQSQHPRAFEVLATLMKTMLDANKDLLDLQKKIREISAADEPTNENAKQVTNNLFVGSTADLQKAIEDMKNGSKSA